MDETYQRLASEVAGAGGRLDLAPGALPSRLGRPVDAGDAYAQYIVRRQLTAVGLIAEFHADGGVTLVDQAIAETPAARPTSTVGAATPISRPAPEAAAPDDLGGGGGPPAPPDRPPPTQLTAKQIGSTLYWLLVAVCTFFPAIGHQLVPGGEVGEKQDAFFAIYFATFPLSLAATFIFLMLFFQWLDSDTERAVAAGVAIVVSSVWGIGFGLSYADLSLISQVDGPPPAVLLQVVGLALAAYATFYGWFLFIAGWLSSFFAALWIKEKASEVQKVLS